MRHFSNFLLFFLLRSVGAFRWRIRCRRLWLRRYEYDYDSRYRCPGTKIRPRSGSIFCGVTTRATEGGPAYCRCIHCTSRCSDTWRPLLWTRIAAVWFVVTGFSGGGDAVLGFSLPLEWEWDKDTLVFCLCCRSDLRHDQISRNSVQELPFYYITENFTSDWKSYTTGQLQRHILTMDEIAPGSPLCTVYTDKHACISTYTWTPTRLLRTCGWFHHSSQLTLTRQNGKTKPTVVKPS